MQPKNRLANEERAGLRTGDVTSDGATCAAPATPEATYPKMQVEDIDPIPLANAVIEAQGGL